MIGVILDFAGEMIEVRVEGTNCYFRNTNSYNSQGCFVTIDSLHLDKAGTIKEFPDLKEEKNWESIARNRFKEKIKTFNTEDERINYIISDLKKFGYVPLYKQKAGFRPERL